MPDLQDLSQDWEVPAEVFTLMTRLRDHGHEAYLIGGAVRDLLLGRAPGDFDLASSASPDVMQEIFADYPQVLTGLKHGTVGVILNRKLYEITTFREDIDYRDHRRPNQVRFSTLAKDLERRDFTINALAWNPDSGLVDQQGGLEDLRAGLIRAVGDPFRRFGEDALRIMRAYRLAATYGFAIETETLRAARHLFTDLGWIAPERITAELRRILTADHFANQLALQEDILFYLFPEANRKDPRFTAEAFRKLPPDFATRLSLIGLLMPESTRAQALSRLRLSREESRIFFAYTSAVDHKPSWPKPPALLLHTRAYGIDSQQWLKLLEAIDEAPDYVEAVQAALATIEAEKLPATPTELAISGRDLLARGWPEGPKLGQVLESLWDEVIRGVLKNEAGALLARAAEVRK